MTPLRVARGSRLVGDALEVLVGGQVPVGFNSGDVTVEMVADATGYLFPNPTSASPNAAKNLRLFLDLSTTTDDARANGAFTQNLLHVELVGRAIVRDGVLSAPSAWWNRVPAWGTAVCWASAWSLPRLDHRPGPAG